VEQNVQSVISPLCFTEALEEVVEGDDIETEACPEELAEEGWRQIRAARTGAAVHDDVVGT
jgi:hypothetical protein